MQSDPSEPRNAVGEELSAVPLAGWQRRRLSPGRGLIYLLALVLTLLNFDTAWGVVSHSIIILLEIGEEFLDVVLEHLGLGSGAAQMVTAYIGLTLLLLLMAFLARKAVHWPAQFSALMRDYREMYVHVIRAGIAAFRAEFKAWWATLDWLGKTLAIIAGVVVVIPLFVALSFGLGYLVSMALM